MQSLENSMPSNNNICYVTTLVKRQGKLIKTWLDLKNVRTQGAYRTLMAKKVFVTLHNCFGSSSSSLIHIKRYFQMLSN